MIRLMNAIIICGFRNHISKAQRFSLFFFERTVFVTFFLEEEIFSTGPSKATYLAFIEREDRSEKRGKSTSFKTPYNISALL